MSRKIRQTLAAYDYLAERYAEEWACRLDSKLAQRFVELSGEGALALDAGCGPAHYSRFFSQRGLKVVSIDASSGMLRVARRVWRDGRFALMDLRSLGFGPGTFDAVWACASLPHIPCYEIPRALAQLRRVLRKDGVLFANWILGDRPSRTESVEEMGADYGRPGRFFQWYPNSEVCLSYLEEASFSVQLAEFRRIESHVLPEAVHSMNQWVNFFCRAI